MSYITEEGFCTQCLERDRHRDAIIGSLCFDCNKEIESLSMDFDDFEFSMEELEED